VPLFLVDAEHRRVGNASIFGAIRAVLLRPK